MARRWQQHCIGVVCEKRLDLAITFRRDPTNHRPRINKLDSLKDREQKLSGEYFFLDTDDDEDEGDGGKGRKKK